MTLLVYTCLPVVLFNCMEYFDLVLLHCRCHSGWCLLCLPQVTDECFVATCLSLFQNSLSLLRQRLRLCVLESASSFLSKETCRVHFQPASWVSPFGFSARKCRRSSGPLTDSLWLEWRKEPLTTVLDQSCHTRPGGRLWSLELYEPDLPLLAKARHPVPEPFPPMHFHWVWCKICRQAHPGRRRHGQPKLAKPGGGTWSYGLVHRRILSSIPWRSHISYETCTIALYPQSSFSVMLCSELWLLPFSIPAHRGYHVHHSKAPISKSHLPSSKRHAPLMIRCPMARFRSSWTRPQSAGLTRSDLWSGAWFCSHCRRTSALSSPSPYSVSSAWSPHFDFPGSCYNSSPHSPTIDNHLAPGPHSRRPTQ